MNENTQTNPAPRDSVRGPVIEKERRNDETTEGQDLLVTETLVQHASLPDEPEFGLLSSRVTNERNRNKSRLENTYVDTDALTTLSDIDYNGLEALGADLTTIEKHLEDVTDLEAVDLSGGHLILSDKLTQFDKVHARRATTTTDRWNPRIDRIKGSPRAGGNDELIVKQVVSEDDDWPDESDNNIELRREHIGVDKYLQIHAYAPDGKGSLTSKNNFGMESCPTTTEERPVGTNFDMPAPTVDMLEQSLIQVSGLEKIYKVTTLDNGWPTLISYEEEPVTGKRVTVTRTVHGTEPTVNVDGTARSVVNVRHTGCNRWTKTVREIDASVLSETFLEYHSVDYTFPAYLDPDNPFIIHKVGLGTELINTNKSSAHRFKIPCRFEITYHSSAPVASEVFQFKTVSINVDLQRGNIREQNVITDAVTVTTTVFNQVYEAAMQWVLQTYGAAFSENNIPPAFTKKVNFSFPASSPSASEYIGYMTGQIVNGQQPPHEVLILEDSSRWKYNLWRRVKVFMKFPDLTQGLDGSLIY